jgi:hypothetical protein
MPARILSASYCLEAALAISQEEEEKEAAAREDVCTHGDGQDSRK